MSAAGRLWRRAPAWRLWLFGALAATALAAMFPPAVPAWVRGLDRAAAGQGDTGGSAPGATARFVPQPTAIPAEKGFVELEAPAGGRSGIVPFAGRQLLLPGGSWQTLVLARGSKPIAGQLELLARVEGGSVTGLLVAAAPDPVAHQPSPFNEPQDCAEPDSTQSWMAPEPFGTDPLVHECWRLAPLRDVDLANRAREEPVMGHGLLRLEQAGDRFPEKLVVVDYLRSDETGFLKVLLFLPDKQDKKMDAWVRRYVSALHEGYDGTLGAKVLERDPG